MEAELRAGVKLDLASGAELREQTEQLRAELRRAQALTVTLTATTATTSAAGDLGTAGVVLYECPVGMIAKVHRLMFDAAAYTPAAPLTTGWLKWQRNVAGTAGGLLGFLPVGGAVLPAWVTEGQHDAALLRSGETLVLAGGGLPASLTIAVELQVALYEVEQA